MKKLWMLALAAVLIFLSAVLFTVAVMELKNPPPVFEKGDGSWEKPDGRYQEIPLHNLLFQRKKFVCVNVLQAPYARLNSPA